MGAGIGLSRRVGFVVGVGSLTLLSRLTTPLTSATVVLLSRAPGDCVGTATAVVITVLVESEQQPVVEGGQVYGSGS